MYRSLLCKILGHQYGEWEDISIDICEQRRICKRDGFEQRRLVEHRFNSWEYVSDDSCEQKRACKQHNFEVKRSIYPGQDYGHNFGKWEYTSDDSCRQRRFCKQHNFSEYRTAEHQFPHFDGHVTDSPYAASWIQVPGKDYDVLACSKCGRTLYRIKKTGGIIKTVLFLVEKHEEIDHYWDEPYPNYGREDIQHQREHIYYLRPSQKNFKEGDEIKKLSFFGQQTRINYQDPDNFSHNFGWGRGAILVETKIINALSPTPTYSDLRNYQGMHEWIIAIKEALQNINETDARQKFLKDLFYEKMEEAIFIPWY